MFPVLTQVWCLIVVTQSKQHSYANASGPVTQNTDTQIYAVIFSLLQSNPTLVIKWYHKTAQIDFMEVDYDNMQYAWNVNIIAAAAVVD